MKYLKDNPTLIVLLLAAVVVFFYSYWANIYRPGALLEGGWYGAWADQRRYYEQAQAIANFNLTHQNFHYPILYPLLGALFVKIFARDPFFFVNLGLFVATVGLLYALIEKVFDRQKALFGTILLLSTQRFVYDFVTPWTTSVTTPLFLASVYILFTRPYTIKRLIVLSTLTGFAFLARITDVVFFIPIVIGFIVKNTKNQSRILIKRAILASFFLATTVVPFILFNLMISGSIVGPYVERVITRFEIRITPLTLLEKIIGFFGNSFIFHRQIEFFALPVMPSLPLLLILLLFLPVVLPFIQQKQYKIIHLSILASFVVWFVSYLPYGAIAPYTLKNLAVHYVKLWYPVTIFYSMYIIDTLSVKKLEKSLIKKIFIVGLILLFLPLVIQKLQPRPLAKDGWQTESSINSKQIVLIIDSNDNTAWSTLRPRQRKDEVFVDMKDSHIVSRLQLVDNATGAATDFDTFVSEDKKNWQELAPNYTYNVRRDYGWDVVGYMQRGRYIRLVLNETSEADPWIIREITVFGY